MPGAGTIPAVSGPGRGPLGVLSVRFETSIRDSDRRLSKRQDQAVGGRERVAAPRVGGHPGARLPATRADDVLDALAGIRAVIELLGDRPHLAVLAAEQSHADVRAVHVLHERGEAVVVATALNDQRTEGQDLLDGGPRRAGFRRRRRRGSGTEPALLA